MTSITEMGAGKCVAAVSQLFIEAIEGGQQTLERLGEYLPKMTDRFGVGWMVTIAG